MKPHRLELLPLVAGGAFVTIGLMAISGGLPGALLRTTWLWPVALGVVGLAVLRSALRRRDDTA